MEYVISQLRYQLTNFDKIPIRFKTTFLWRIILLTVREMDKRLYERYGNTRWWPAETRDEVVIGTILTQNTSWSNVEKAIDQLRLAGCLSLKCICTLESGKLETLIRSAGFFRQKAERLRNLSCSIVSRYGGLEKMITEPREEVEKFLSSQKGVGRETLDSILLYALDFPEFVVDKYTLRIFSRTGIEQEPTIESVKEAVASSGIRDPDALKNLHGMIVYLGKDHCRTKPKCSGCPLLENCQYGHSLNERSAE